MIKVKLLNYLRYVSDEADEEHDEAQGVNPSKALKAKERGRVVRNLSEMILSGEFD